MTLDLSGLTGVTLYEPAELVLSAKAGTPLAEIEALLAKNNQELAFEPADYGPVLGGEAGQRDARRRHRDEPRRPAPHQGRRGARPFPRRHGGDGPRRDHQVRRPRGEERHRLRHVQAHRRLLRHAGGDDRCDAEGAAQGRNRGDRAGRGPRRRRSVPRDERRAGLAGRCVRRGASARPHRLVLRRPAEAGSLDRAADRRRRAVGRASQGSAGRAAEAVRRGGDPRCAEFARLVARASATSSRSPARPRIYARCGGCPCRRRRHTVWWTSSRRRRRCSTTGPAAWSGWPCRSRTSRTPVRSAPRSAAIGGHATLVRAPAAVRAAVDVFEPEQAAIAALNKRVKESFDPKGVLNPGRMWAGV